ncbi:MAG: alpha/beta fold hydrolase [Thermoguttaceae bacterium]|nr:alpha/beta fold hydrolase [Thermoguttaceae bacterium]
MSPKTNDSLWRPLYPYESHFLNVGGFNLHYVDEKPADWRPGAPVLFMVHGNPTWSFFFRARIDAFRGKCRVIAVDQIGCGLSDKPAAKAYPYRIKRRVSDLCELVEKLGLTNVTLIAHDWGGAIGMGCAEKLHKRFSRLVLMNTAAFRSQRCPFRIYLGRIPFLSPFLIQGLNAFCRGALRWATEKPGGLAPEVAAGLVAPYDSWRNRIAVSKFVRDVPLSDKDPSYDSLVEIEENLPLFRDKPVLLCWGVRDWCFPTEFLKRFLSDFPEAEVRKIDSAGHYLLEDAPEEVIEALTAFFEKYPV